ncbi:UvrD-helicase domain-containing protein [bacterium]|nr:UvrD-helicase domain-containing protein [bacterium]
MEYLAGLNERQKEAVLHIQGPLLIVAGAGAGKTKTITNRAAYMIKSGIPAHKILAVTFTNKAAAEMRNRISSLLLPGEKTGAPFTTTFHSLGVRLLREFSDAAGIPRAFVIWDRDDSIRALKRVLVAAGLENRFPPRQVLSRISKEKGNGMNAETFLNQASSHYAQSIAEAWLGYEKALKEEGALDFDDLLLRTLSLLRNSPETLAKIQHRWQHLTIDEYQDTNAAQYEIARLIAGDRHNICAVGDIDQNIYSWRGADISHLLSFEKTFPGTKVVLLEENYRSTQTILTAANAVISKNTRRFDKRLITGNPTGEAITLFAGDTDRDEAFFVARSVRELLGSGVKASEIAVLFRENFQSRSLEEAFISVGLPYRVLGVRFFDRAEVKDALAYLRGALNPASFTDFSRAAGVPSRGIGKTTLEKIAAGKEDTLAAAARTKIANFRSVLESIRNDIHTLRASEAVRSMLTRSGLEAMLANGSEEERERLNNVFELVAHSTRYDTLPAPEGIERLLEDAALMGEQDALQDRQEAVSLMTVHASKGLEFDAVFVTGMEHGLFPSERESDGERDNEEERRLFYVALTRARKFLYLTLAGSRLRYGSREMTIPSTFLEDIDSRLITYAHDHLGGDRIIR